MKYCLKYVSYDNRNIPEFWVSCLQKHICNTAAQLKIKVISTIAENLKFLSCTEYYDKKWGVVEYGNNIPSIITYNSLQV